MKQHNNRLIFTKLITSRKIFTKETAWIPAIFVGLLLGFLISQYYEEWTDNDMPPSAVIEDFEIMSQEWENKGGARLMYCSHIENDDLVYVISAGMLSGKRFYYDQTGNKIGSAAFSDMPIQPSEPSEPPVNLQKYNCADLR